tara:strand:- start:497 stop:913 length:417 start_codon:yes stop_codon:yes gene_type:complete
MTANERMEMILKNHTALKAGRLRFATRLKEAKRYRGKIADRFDALSMQYEVSEERFAVLDAIEDFESGVRQQIAHIERELAKIEKGIDSLAQQKSGKLKKAFEEYVIADTNQTLTHISMTCYEYDLIMDSVKEIERTT